MMMSSCCLTTTHQWARTTKFSAYIYLQYVKVTGAGLTLGESQKSGLFTQVKQSEMYTASDSLLPTIQSKLTHTQLLRVHEEGKRARVQEVYTQEKKMMLARSTRKT